MEEDLPASTETGSFGRPLYFDLHQVGTSIQIDGSLTSN
jgi:hypothetical protein